VVAWSEIRAIRRVVKQQFKCFNNARVRAAARLCRSALSLRSTTPDVSAPHLFYEWSAPNSHFNVSQYTSGIIVVSCCKKSIISTHSMSRKTVSISFLVDRQRLFKPFFRLVFWMFAPTALAILWFQHSEIKSGCCHLLLVRCD
jgi:hypothetical protein